MNVDNDGSLEQSGASQLDRIVFSGESNDQNILGSTPAQKQTQISGITGNSDRKRNRRTMDDDGTLDDILGQITSKLTSLSTTEGRTEQDSIKAFTDVLNCSLSEAQFYLESSNWNVETAVMLWLENNPLNSNAGGFQPTLGFADSSYAYHSALGGVSFAPVRAFQRPKATPLYRCKQVHIPDLTEGWTAQVSKSSGQVYFIHVATGTTQFSVPPGYADAGRDADSAIDLSGNGNGNGNGGNSSSSGKARGNRKQSGGNSGMDSSDSDSASEGEGECMDEAGDAEGEGMRGTGSAARTEPISPTGLAPCCIPQNALLEGSPARSGVKYNSAASSCAGGSGEGRRKGRQKGSTIIGAGNDTGGIFRSAMDAYACDNDGNSDRAVWDEASSGYSLCANDPLLSVSSAADLAADSSACSSDSPLFGSLAHSRAVSGGPLLRHQQGPQGQPEQQQGFLPHPGTLAGFEHDQHQHQYQPLQQSLPESQQQQQHQQQNQQPGFTYPLTQPQMVGSGAQQGGIAMLAAASDVDNGSDYFLGSAHSSAAEL